MENIADQNEEEGTIQLISHSSQFCLRRTPRRLFSHQTRKKRDVCKKRDVLLTKQKLDRRKYTMGRRYLHAITVIAAVLLAYSGRATGVQSGSTAAEERNGAQPQHDFAVGSQPDASAPIKDLTSNGGRKRRSENILKGTERHLHSSSSSSSSKKSKKSCKSGSGSKSSKSSKSCDGDGSPTAAPVRSLSPALANKGPATLNPALGPTPSNDDLAFVYENLFLTSFDQARDVTNDAVFSSAIADVYVFEDDVVCVDLYGIDLTSSVEAIEIYFGLEGDIGTLELEIVPFSDPPISGSNIIACAEGNPDLTLDLLLIPDFYFLNVSTEDNVFGEVRSQLFEF